MSEKLQEETQLDEEILWKIKYDIYKLEEDNLKTKQKTDSGMVEAIRKIIIDALSDKKYEYYKMKKEWIKETLEFMKQFDANPIMYYKIIY